MDADIVYRKTDLGFSEIASVRRSVDFRLRPLLILVDGQRSTSRIQALLGDSAAPDEYFSHLASGGYIEPIDDDEPMPEVYGPEPVFDLPIGPVTLSTRRFADCQHFMIETAAAKMGLLSFLFVLRIEKCDTIEALVALLPEFENGIARRFDPEHARQCRREAQSLLLN